MALDTPRYTRADKWTPRHYGDELHEEGLRGRDRSVHLFDRDVDTTDRLACCRAEVRCPNCDRRIEAAHVVDCRHVPDDLSDGASWACDGCWTRWVRPTNHNRAQRMAEAEWAALHGAPKKVVDRFRNVMAKRKVKGWSVGERLSDRLDLDAVTERADDPRELRWEERTSDRGET